MEVLTPADSEEEVGVDGGRPAFVSAPAVDLLFLPGSPPRYGTFAVYIPPDEPGPLVAEWSARRTGDGRRVPRVPDPPDGQYFAGAVQIVRPTPRAVRRREVPAHDIAMADALTWLLDLEEAWRARPSIAAWSGAAVAGLGLLARGRFVPAVTPEGWDAWRAGPFDAEDCRLLEQVAASLPPAAHCVPLGCSRESRRRSGSTSWPGAPGWGGASCSCGRWRGGLAAAAA